MSMREMMTRDVPLLDQDDTLAEGVAQLRRAKLDALPVTGKDGRLLGIFTKAKLMDAFLAGAQLSESLSGYVESRVVTVQADTPYAEVERRVKLSPVGTGVVVDSEGKVLGIFTKVNMIAALFKEAEQMAAKLNSIYAALPHGLMVVDAHDRIERLNPAGARILGVNEETLKGCSLVKVCPGLDLSAVLKSAQHVSGVRVEIKGVKVLCNISPVGKGAGAVVAFQAIIDLEQIALELETTKRLYETLKTVINIAYEAIFVVDEQGRITLVNEATCRFFGKEEEELLHHPVDDVLENNRLLRTLKTGMAETNEIQMIRGQPHIVSRIPIVRQGRVVGVVGKIVYQKIEEVKEVAERLAELDGELRCDKEKEGLERQAATFNRIVTVNPDMVRLKQDAETAARGSSTILLTGESGTGKELFAEAIHHASPKRKGPFVRVNCAAVPENLLESEFFGYVNGAFTGAQKGGRPGKFAQADGGTLFLDEIGDMSLNLQSKLLRVIENRTFEPLGSNGTVKVDVRIIAATNQDLLRNVEKGTFRRDLYYRLNVINFHLLPLRRRPEDIVPLAHVFLEQLNLDSGREIKGMSPLVEMILKAHAWPGNVRELKNVLERSVNLGAADRLEAEDLPLYLREPRREGNVKGVLSRSEGWSPQRPFPAGSHQDPIGKESLARALAIVHGNKSEAARLLGISRSWLYEKMRRYNMG
ncbi:RNA polymerase sigma factor 54 interaction domain protein [Acididesulfobacillus acetoxydans]|uniref:Acetoacetate metabolism regulatory protein AtoC n=1 Tax=Acididesulfobacillus acetoxydans TaxID=1561005 RepID=A0A8S0WNF3_9FIRM|nr:sigma 54-interacting transcriptional regulator [Acididesulfobacillus acetoxydans]CAA7601294.1 RNA polymerase sigma factor 54 interaction domain protein [Acididesulfobacillus acetoxydans]CEJ08796.1 Acetoacetate metabolism regulatory protein AtoC [Acididesulfobacillus acetoxydans]